MMNKELIRANIIFKFKKNSIILVKKLDLNQILNHILIYHIRFVIIIKIMVTQFKTYLLL
jgi:hypothetical protein